MADVVCAGWGAEIQLSPTTLPVYPGDRTTLSITSLDHKAFTPALYWALLRSANTAVASRLIIN